MWRMNCSTYAFGDWLMSISVLPLTSNKKYDCFLSPKGALCSPVLGNPYKQQFWFCGKRQPQITSTVQNYSASMCFKMKPIFIVPSDKSYVKKGANRILHGENYCSHTEIYIEYLYHVEHLYCFLCFKVWLKSFPKGK